MAKSELSGEPSSAPALPVVDDSLRLEAMRTVDAQDLKRHALRGSAWMIAWRWTSRLLGLVNTMILVRLLTPADFGVYSMAMLVVGVIEIFAESGQSLAL